VGYYEEVARALNELQAEGVLGPPKQPTRQAQRARAGAGDGAGADAHASSFTFNFAEGGGQAAAAAGAAAEPAGAYQVALDPDEELFLPSVDVGPVSPAKVSSIWTPCMHAPLVSPILPTT
jgi:hypothetical protein